MAVDRYDTITWNPRTIRTHSRDEELNVDGDYCHWEDVRPILEATTEVMKLWRMTRTPLRFHAGTNEVDLRDAMRELEQRLDVEGLLNG